MKARTLILALAPVYRGMGYIVLDFDGMPLDWGTSDTRHHDAPTTLKRAHSLITTFEPKTLVLELTSTPSCRLKQRMRDLIGELAVVGRQCDVDLAFHGRAAVIRCLGLQSSASKDRMAAAVALEFPALAYRLPKPRRIWESEKHSMAMFVAAGLALAQLGEARDHKGRQR